MHSQRLGKDPAPEGKGSATISPTSEPFAAVLAAEPHGHRTQDNLMRSYPEKNIMAATESDLLEAINQLAVTFVMSSFDKSSVFS